jgi:hypothetical protein
VILVGGGDGTVVGRRGSTFTINTSDFPGAEDDPTTEARLNAAIGTAIGVRCSIHILRRTVPVSFILAVGPNNTGQVDWWNWRPPSPA